MNSRYSLRRSGPAWDLTFAGKRAYVKDQCGLHCVAWLLAHPHASPIHAVELVQRRRHDDGVLVRQRSPGLDETDRILRIYLADQQLRAFLENPGELNGLERHEAEAEVAALQNCRQRGRWLDQAQKCTRAVHKSMYRLYDQLLSAEDRVLAAFGDHLWQYLLVPSGRWVRGRRAGPSHGCYVYEPPEGVCWD